MMHKIRDWLFVGQLAHTHDRALLNQYGITAMLQLHHPVPQQGIETMFLPVMDGHAIDTVDVQKAAVFVKAQHAAGRKLLVACGAGVSRSVTFAVMTLKEIEGITMEEAYLDIRSKHRDALPDQVHWESVRAHYGGEGKTFWEIWRKILSEG